MSSWVSSWVGGGEMGGMGKIRAGSEMSGMSGMNEFVLFELFYSKFSNLSLIRLVIHE